MSILESIGMNAADTAVNTGVSALTQRGNSHYARKMARYNDELQRSLIRDSASLQAQSLRRAGLSVASLNGNFSSVNNAATASTPEMGTPERGDISSSYLNYLSGRNMKKQNELLTSQNREVAARAYAQELENKVREDEIESVRNATSSSIIRYRGKDYSIADFSRIFPDVEIGGKDADGNEAEFVKIAGHMSINAVSVAQKLAENERLISEDSLRKMVSDSKLQDDSVMDALSKVDKAQYDHIRASLSKILEDVSLQKKVNVIQQNYIDNQMSYDNKARALEYDMQKIQYDVYNNTDARKLISDIMENGLSWESAGKVVLMSIIGLIQNFATPSSLGVVAGSIGRTPPAPPSTPNYGYGFVGNLTR